jgi:hypothetical protein
MPWVRKQPQSSFPFLVRYLTMNGNSSPYGRMKAITLRYRRVNAIFDGTIDYNAADFLTRSSAESMIRPISS